MSHPTLPLIGLCRYFYPNSTQSQSSCLKPSIIYPTEMTRTNEGNKYQPVGVRVEWLHLAGGCTRILDVCLILVLWRWSCGILLCMAVWFVLGFLLLAGGWCCSPVCVFFFPQHAGVGWWLAQRLRLPALKHLLVSVSVLCFLTPNQTVPRHLNHSNCCFIKAGVEINLYSPQNVNSF